jgi:uncharacterized membrane protein YgcG
MDREGRSVNPNRVARHTLAILAVLGLVAVWKWVIAVGLAAVAAAVVFGGGLARYYAGGGTGGYWSAVGEFLVDQGGDFSGGGDSGGGDFGGGD